MSEFLRIFARKLRAKQDNLKLSQHCHDNCRGRTILEDRLKSIRKDKGKQIWQPAFKYILF